MSKHATRDHYEVISSKYREKLSTEEIGSGIEVEQTRLKVLQEELIEQVDLSEEEGKEKLNRISVKPTKFEKLQWRTLEKQ